jgi:hypothetical protein
MKSIGMKTKAMVVKLFLEGESYDDIAQQVGIAKGSVVNIIEEFRDGVLQVPAGLTGYVDLLRKLAVDLRKNHTTVEQAMSCHKLETRIKAKGVSGEKLEQWLDVVESIAKPGVSNEDFVQAALELAEATAKSGKGYTAIVQDCVEKQAVSTKLDSEIDKKKKEDALLDQEHESKVRKHTSELKIITDAAETAQATFESQKQNLAQQTEELMYQKNLTFASVNTASAILNTELGKVGLDKEGIHQVTVNIAKAGSLTVYNKNLEDKKRKLEAEIQERVEKKEALGDKAEKLQMKIKKGEMVIVGQEYKRDQLEAEIKAMVPELEELKKSIKEDEATIYQAHLIIAFLVSPKSIKGQVLDDLVRLLLALRQKTLGIEPTKVKDADGKVLWECPVPIIDTLDVVNANIDNIREKLALNLVPLVKDYFVPILQHKMETLESHIAGGNAMLNKLGYPTT